MKRILKYLALVAVNYRSERVYLANWAARFFGITLRVWIFAQLYRATYTSIGADVVHGLSISNVIWVLAFTQCFGIMTGAHTSRVVSEEVRTGNLAYLLNRPCSYILMHYFTFWGKGVSFLAESIVAGTVVTYILVGSPSLTAQSLACGLVLLLFGATLHFLIAMTVGLIAFWTEDVSAFDWIYQKFSVILGGMLIPPELFTPFWRDVAQMLPFSQLFYSAARATVAFDNAVFVHSLTMQLVWISVFGMLVMGMYRAGSMRVCVNGG